MPIAVTGSERARDGWKIKPVQACTCAAGAPLTFPRVENPSPFLAGEVTERIWPCVELQWEWLGGLPPLRTAAVVGGGSMGTAISSVLARAGLEVQLGCRTRGAGRAARWPSARTPPTCPGVALDGAIEPKTVREIEFAGVDLVVLAVPCSSLPAAVGEVGARDGRPQRRAGRLEGPRAAARHDAERPTSPSGCAPAPSPAWRGPAHAREAIEGGASVVVATRDPRPAPPAQRRARRPAA